MRKACLLFLALIMMAVAKAQDVITFTNGSTAQAKVLAINPDNIQYKDYNNPDGPTITVLKSGVASIQYANGTKTVFNEGGSSSRPAGGREQFVRSSDGKPDRSGGGFHRKKDRDTHLHGWYFGAEFSIGGVSMGSNDPYVTPDGGIFDGLNLSATYMFNPHIGIQFGIGAQEYLSDISTGSDDFTASYYDIPVRALYLSNSKKKCGFYAMAGVDFQFLSHASDNENDDISDYYNSVLISPMVSCGVEFRVHKGRSFWMFGPYFRTSVGNVYSGNGINTSFGGLDPGNTGGVATYGLSIVYMSKFRGQRW